MSRLAWAVVLTVSLAPMVLGLRNDVQDVDPAQYADVARRMVASGDWLHLRDQNGPFWNKPPLTMWLQAAGMSLFGVDAFAVRLPGLVFAVITVLATLRIGRVLGGDRRGLSAAAIAGGLVSTHVMVLDPKVDAALTAMTTAAVALMLEGRERPRLRLAAWVVAGLAVLAKGPIGLGVAVLALLPEVVRVGWASGSLARRLLSVSPLGAVLTALVVAPFYLATHEATGDEGVLYMLWYQGFGRLFGKSGFIDDTSPFFFMHTALWVFLPATPLLVLTLSRRAVELARTRRLPPSLGRVPLWWFGLTFVVLSLSTYKLPQYLYPLAPPVALLVAEELERLDEQLAARWWWAFWGGAALVVPFVALVFAAAFSPSPVELVLWITIVSAVPVGLWWARRKVEQPLVVALSLSAVGAMAFLGGFVQPRVLEYQPSKALGALVRATDPGAQVLPFVFTDPAFSCSFYAQRDARYLMPDGLAAFVAEHGPTLAVVGPDGPFEALAAEGLKTEVLATYDRAVTSRVGLPFYRAQTRATTLHTVRLVRVWKDGVTSSSSTPPR